MTYRHPDTFKYPAPACQTPGCISRCPYAYNCHERRMGHTGALRWPLISLALFLILATVALVFQ